MSMQAKALEAEIVRTEKDRRKLATPDGFLHRQRATANRKQQRALAKLAEAIGVDDARSFMVRVRMAGDAELARLA